MRWDWRDATLPVAFALQDLGKFLRRRGEALETLLDPGMPILASAASTWADYKALRHILPLDGETEVALCGLEPGIFGWQNQNGIYRRDLAPAGYCGTCRMAFQGSLPKAGPVSRR